MTTTTKGKTMTEYETNLTKALSRALACTSCEGAEQWYYEMGRWIRGEARTHGIPVDRAFAGFAVLSTNSTVELNMRNFSKWIRGRKVSHFGDVKRRLALAKSGDVDGALSYKKGRKIVSFYANLRYPYRQHGAITIDRHAARMLIDDVDAARLGKNLLARKRGYEVAMSAYANVAETVGLKGHELQARTWVHLVDCGGL